MKGRFFLSLLIVLFATSAVAQTTSHRLQSSKHPDVSTSAPSNNQCLVYVAATGKWTPGSCSAGAGDVTKVGTPAQYYLGIWTGDGTLGSVAALGSAGNPLISGGAAANPSFLSVVLAGGTNTFSITNGTASLDVAAGATLNIDKSLQVATGAVVINGNAGGSSVLTLPNQTTVIGTLTDGKWCSYASSGTTLSCTQDAPAGSGDVTDVGDCAGGACYDGSSDGGTYIRLYDGNSHYTQYQAGDSTGNLTFITPNSALARGSLMVGSSTANTFGWLTVGTSGKIITTDGTDPSWSAYTVAAPGAAGAVLYSDGTNWTRAATLSVTLDNAAAQFVDSSVATKKMKIDPVGMTAGKTLTLKGSFDQSTTIDFVNTALSADDKTLTFAVPITDNATYTFPAATATLAILGANTFTALQTYDATAGIQVGATGVGITSDDDGAITFTGKSAGYDEDLTLNFDDTENTVVVSSSTGVTKIDFSALNLATTGIITGAVNTNSDANGMSSSEMTAAGMYGTMFWATGAGTWNLPGAATGMSFCVYSTTAAAIVINPDDGDTIVLNGTALSAGDSITSASGAGDFICLLAKDANTWYTLGRSGTWTDTN